MATLTGQEIKDRYKDFLQVSNTNSGVDATKRQVEDGEGTGSALYLDTGGFGLGSNGDKLYLDADADSYLIASGDDVVRPSTAGNIAMTWDAAGIVAKPLQPSFLVVNSGDHADVTGDGTAFTITFDTDIYDTNADISSGTFTAPVGGKYLFTAGIRLAVGGAHNDCSIELVTTNRTYALYQFDPNDAQYASSGITTSNVSVIADMDAGETATLRITVSGGTATADVLANGGTGETYFSGALL